MKTTSKKTELKFLVGEHVTIYLKNTTSVIGNDGQNDVLTNAIAGHVVKVTSNYVYLSENSAGEGTDGLVDLEQIGVIFITAPENSISEINPNAH